MADTKISAMPAAATLDGTEIVPLVQGGLNVQDTVTNFVSETIQVAPGDFRDDLGLGTIAVQDADNVSITGGSISDTTVAGYVPTTRTLTAGVGGSLLAIGSAAGVGLLGQMEGKYSFVSHLKWTPVIALGYAGSIVAHFLLNGRYF